MTWQVVAAVIGAWFIAIGAAAQEQPATAAEGEAVGRLHLVWQLLRNPRWLVGGLVTVVGMGLHLAALTTAPLTIVQPLGISGLLVAVWVAARWRRRRLTGVEWFGAAAVTVGLIGLVANLPHDTDVAPMLADGHLVVLSVIAGPLAMAAVLGGHLLGARSRAAILAAVAGLCFGVTAALVRVISHDLRDGWSALWHWRALVALGLVAIGGLILQNAYRAGHFGLSYAVLLVVDPIVAAGVGVVFLAEPLPTTVFGGITAALSAALTVIGVVALARTARPPAGTRSDEPLTPHQRAVSPRSTDQLLRSAVAPRISHQMTNVNP